MGTPLRSRRPVLPALFAGLLLSASIAPNLHAGTTSGAPPLVVAVDDGVWRGGITTPSPGSSQYPYRAIHDTLRGRMLLVTGSPDFEYDGVWTLALGGPPEWNELAVLGVPAGTGQAIYDAARDRVLVWGFSDQVSALDLSPVVAWSTFTPAGPLPPTREDHVAVYDPLRDRMIVFGGSVRNDVWALSLSGTPTWSRILPEGNPPLARSGAVGVYDPLGDRLIVAGGSGLSRTGAFGDVWALSLSGAPRWTQLFPSGPYPPSRGTASAAYDASRHRVLLFGGDDGADMFDDVWALSLAEPAAWYPLAPAGGPPAGRRMAGMVPDPALDRLVIFGGFSGTGYYALSDTWALDLDADSTSGAWSLLVSGAAAPAARWRHNAVTDPSRDQMLVYGGLSPYASKLRDLWSLDLTGASGWSQVPIPGTLPSQRFAPALAYDPVRDRLVLFGGQALDDSYLADLWTLSRAPGSSWQQLAPGPGPAARAGTEFVYDPVRDRMVLFGGYAATGERNDTWALSLSGSPAWQQVVPPGTPPPARWRHSTVLDVPRDRIVVFGGVGGLSDAWALPLSGTDPWTDLAPAGESPRGRWDHGAAYDPLRQRMIVYAGFVDLQPSDEVWALYLESTPVWARLGPSGIPPAPRYAATAVVDVPRDRLVIFGGHDGTAPRNDTKTLEWNQMVTDVSRVTYDVSGSVVRLTWFLSGPPGDLPRVYRRAGGGPWRMLGVVLPDASNRVHFEDPSAPAGVRLAYRVGFRGFTGGSVFSEPVWIEIPGPRALLVDAVRPNPIRGEGWVDFTAPQAGRVRIELLDVSGRRVWERDLGMLAAGAHQEPIRPSRPLDAGIYFVRVAQGDRAATGRVAVVR